jgi:hypothetical protein
MVNQSRNISEIDPEDVNFLKRDKDKINYLHEKLSDQLNPQNKKEATKIVKSVDQLLGLVIDLEEAKKKSDQQMKEEESKNRQIQAEEIHPKGKLKAPIKILKSEDHPIKLEEINDNDLSLIMKSIGQEDKSNLSHSILRKTSKSRIKNSGKKSVQFDITTNFLNSSENNVKLKSPPLSPIQVGENQKRKLKKVHFSSGKKAYNQLINKDFHLGIEELNDEEEDKSTKKKFDIFERVNQICEEMNINPNELKEFQNIDLKKEKRMVKEVIEKKVDLTHYQDIFKNIFKKKSDDDESNSKETKDTVKKIDKLKQIKSKLFQNVILDKIKYTMFLK